MIKTFKNMHSFDKRIAESTKIMKKYPDRVPIIIEKQRNSNAPDIDKKKYLVPIDLTVGQLIFVIRRRMKLEKEMAIFVFCKNILPPTSQLINDLYNNSKDDDGFLYIIYASENTFG
tara:strand:+ start:118 stop:468 length:351 start_codon:yes stop_codon:yes gene_type:complete